ncbi:MSMEG_1061 family FMN-dependent PPOX-type flavoprotein [Motilimonas eburnea]|uniref:MSMEG_1061 family FMN-dependent PPOX-type flavoprotein n=1 Tax=Motilimonas eburnea TaxID=1737488 RepID=UPI001E329F80|nr:MSMEG_1061 family FMN-dependent PPOX-type flavoprotein [Motilimonas eburnea]MCE2570368.1 pyridoxamine 5'-phosphate oxidase family protein [Motilimonas eburnea]
MQLASFDQVRDVLGEPNPLAAKKIYDKLNPRMQAFISTSPLVMLSTVDEMGFPTISPKGDEAGFVKVCDEYTLLLPELRGNNLAFSMQNILTTNNKVGLIFLRPGTMETLRVHGCCRLRNTEPSDEVAGVTHRALMVLEIAVDSAYFHCGKAFLRSKIWDVNTYLAPMKISFGTEIAENTGKDAAFVEQADAGVKERYKTDL